MSVAESAGYVTVRLEVLKHEDQESWEIPTPYYYLTLDNAEIVECKADDPAWLLHELELGDAVESVTHSVSHALQKHLNAQAAIA
jgi:hypothetical protein